MTSIKDLFTVAKNSNGKVAFTLLMTDMHDAVLLKSKPQVVSSKKMETVNKNKVKEVERSIKKLEKAEKIEQKKADVDHFINKTFKIEKKEPEVKIQDLKIVKDINNLFANYENVFYPTDITLAVEETKDDQQVVEEAVTEKATEPEQDKSSKEQVEDVNEEKVEEDTNDKIETIKIDPDDVSIESNKNDQLLLPVRFIPLEELIEKTTKEIVAGDIEKFQLNDQQLDQNLLELTHKFCGANPRMINDVACTIFYAADAISLEQLFRHLVDDRDVEIANTISKFFTGFTITKSANTLMINEIMEYGLLFSLVSYMGTMIDGLSDFVDQASNALKEFNRREQEAAGVQNPDPIVPIIFNAEKMDMYRLTKDEKMNILKDFGTLLKPYKYSFRKNPDTGLVSLSIFDNDQRREYIVDPSIYIGDSTYMFVHVYENNPGTNEIGMKPVNVKKHRDIIRKALASNLYLMSPTESENIDKDFLFRSLDEYYMIDMSNYKQVFKRKFTKEEISNLNGVLMKITDNPVLKSNYPNPKFRFEYINGPLDFKLISDINCALPFNNNLQRNIYAGLSVVMSKKKGLEIYDRDQKIYHVNYDKGNFSALY